MPTTKIADFSLPATGGGTFNAAGAAASWASTRLAPSPVNAATANKRRIFIISAPAVGLRFCHPHKAQ